MDLESIEDWIRVRVVPRRIGLRKLNRIAILGHLKVMDECTGKDIIICVIGRKKSGNCSSEVD